MVKLKPITDKSWLVLSDDGLQNIALLSEQRDKYVLIAKEVKTVFTNKQEVEEFFSEKIFNNLLQLAEQDEKIEYFVKGFPVDFDNPFEADAEDLISELPLYTKTQKSDVLYAAGYYCLDFPKGWMPAFCPKLTTLDKYGYKGPFKSEGEMKSVLTQLRRCRR